MNIKVHTNISTEFDDIEIIINAPRLTEEVKKIEEELLSKVSENKKNIIGMQGNDIFLITVSDIIAFYSEGKNNYCRTNDGTYRIKEKMYYLEEILPKNDFIRISNSKIINIDFVKCFNTSIIGKIIIVFKNGTEEIVSRRRTSDILKFLKERGV